MNLKVCPCYPVTPPHLAMQERPSTLPIEFWIWDEERHALLRGRDGRLLSFPSRQAVEARIAELLA